MDFYSGEKHEMSISEEGHLLPPSIAQKEKFSRLPNPAELSNDTVKLIQDTAKQTERERILKIVEQVGIQGNHDV